MATREIPKIEVQRRDRLGSRYAARARKEGRLPAVIYGHKQDPVPVSVDHKMMRDILHQHAHLLEVVLDKKAEPVLVKEVQWDHLGTQIIHLDLARVDLNERVKVDVALKLVGEPVGLKEEGAFLDNPITEIEIECLVTQIPDNIRVDISHLKLDDTLTVRDLKLPEGIKTTLLPDTILAAVHVVREEVVVAAAVEGEAGTEPELIRKAKEGEEGAAEGDAAKPAAGGGAKAAAPAKEGGAKK